MDRFHNHVYISKISTTQNKSEKVKHPAFMVVIMRRYLYRKF